jgi:Ca2+-binding EF-hand superfamily protein
MRKIVALITALGFVFSMSTAALARQTQQEQEAKEKLKKKPHVGDEKKDLKGKADRNRPDAETHPGDKHPREAAEQEDDDDDGGNAGAIIGGVAAAAIVGTVIAKKKGGDGKEKEESVSFGSMDRNKDGSLALVEFQSAMSDGFKAADKNGDSSVTRDEVVAAYGDRGGKYFDALDTKKSGSISMDALNDDAAQAFKWADANDDGSISAAEKATATGEHAAAEQEQKASPKGAKAKKLVRKVT